MELKVHDQEIVLQKLWKSKKLFTHELHTTTGQKIEVIFAGTENLDTGPDFKDAIIKLDGRLLKGDVEVHLDEAGWYAHGHHADPRYNGVILHLISEEPSGKKLIEREDGVQIQQLYLNIETLKTELWRSQKDDLPIKKGAALIVKNCPLSQMGESKILATINEAGERRLHEKVEQVREEASAISWDQMIYMKILEALGYSKNQIPFRKLADLIPYEIVCTEMHWVTEDMAMKKCAALLFGAAGLLPTQSNQSQELLDAETLDYIAPLEYLWQQISHRLEIKSMESQVWQFFRLRPQNFPTRRIAGMVRLIFKFYRQGFLEGFLKIFYGNVKDYDKIASELEAVLTVKAEGYWSNHYRFENMKQKDWPPKDTALIGKERARDIVVNIIFPILYVYSYEAQDGTLKNSIHELFTSYPKLAENSITRAMRNQLFKNQSQKSKIIRSAYQQQGLIYLHKLFCKTLKCSECLRMTQ
ncbi:MAG: DUF2851 family protein [bacterium]